MRLGLTWPGAALGKLAEDAGCAGFCAGEFVDHDAYVSVAEMAAHTERAAVGTGIAYAFSRTPYAHAAAARHLHRMTGDRLFLGFGAGAFKINRDWFGVDPSRAVARLEEFVSVVRAFLEAKNGHRIVRDGSFYEVDALVRAPVLGPLSTPILVGAFNESLLRMSGRAADGIIGHNLFTARWWNEVVRPAVGQGWDTREREGVAVEHGLLLVAIDDEDPEAARLDARRMIAFYLTVRPYDTLVQLHGWGRAAELSRTAFDAGDFDGAARAVTDEMVDEIAFAGTADQVRARLAARADGLPSDIGFMAPPSFMVGRRRRQQYVEASLVLLEQEVSAAPS